MHYRSTRICVLNSKDNEGQGVNSPQPVNSGPGELLCSNSLEMSLWICWGMDPN